MDTKSSTQHWISELTKAWTTWEGALQRWLEVIDPRHRVGRNLSFYFQKWMTVGSGQPFFYWLDVGDGKTEEHPECSREKLRHERNTYLELIATAVLDYLSSQQRQPRYALSGMILSITVMAITLIQLAYIGGKEGANDPVSYPEYGMVIYPEINWPYYIVGKLLIHDFVILGIHIFLSDLGRSMFLGEHWISELPKGWKTWKGALQRWLEVIDPRHRVGRNLSFYFQKWMTVGSGQPFFYWLDVGDGKTEEHPECSRDKLRHERNTYLELDLLRSIFYAMNLLFEIATAVLDYLSSQQRQPRYALSGMILSITVMAISLIQLAYTVGKEGVRKRNDFAQEFVKHKL
ncbi:hypothetical protein D5086_027480 [Populus alba]|uniref:Uncharacterized protein n=1 Tax=Populus alba TaxID=43335 RepID=A0ACC4AWB0_POPAL